MKDELKPRKQRPAVGWREWVALPTLGIDRVKVKVDTGAATSALHAINLKFYKRKSKKFVKFEVHPLQRDTTKSVFSHAQVVEMRKIKSSTGHETERPVIVTDIEIAGERWEIELTLINRDVMGFRMLLGRQALRKRFLVHPGRSFLRSARE